MDLPLGMTERSAFSLGVRGLRSATLTERISGYVTQETDAMRFSAAYGSVWSCGAFCALAALSRWALAALLTQA